jgi:hypothetical protein
MKYGNKELSIILNENEIESCKGMIQEVADNQSTLPPPVQSNEERFPSLFSRLTHLVKYHLPQKPLGEPNSPGEEKPDTPRQPEIQQVSANEFWSDSFLCVNKVWRETEETTARTIKMLDVRNDYEFYVKITKALQDAQGGWLERLVSWKSFNTIDFKKV